MRTSWERVKAELVKPIFRTYDYVMLSIFVLAMGAMMIVPAIFPIKTWFPSMNLFVAMMVLYGIMTLCALAWAFLNQRDEGAAHKLNHLELSIDGQWLEGWNTEKTPLNRPKMAVGRTILYIIIAYFIAIVIQIVGFSIIQTLTGAGSDAISNADEVRRLIDFQQLFIVVVVFCAPIIEEVVFRGILFRRLADAGRYYPAIIFSSALFAVAHMQFLSVFIFFMLGYLLADLYWRTNRLWAPMALHFLVNGVGVLVQLVTS